MMVNAMKQLGITVDKEETEAAADEGEQQQEAPTPAGRAPSQGSRRGSRASAAQQQPRANVPPPP